MSRNSPQLPDAPKSKVFWSDLEREKIVERAVDLLESEPGLAPGLPLLRLASEVLPEKRRRDLIALSQVPWFKRMVAAERERREMGRRSKDDAVSVLREQRDTHATWMAEQLRRYDRLVPAMEKVAKETEGQRRAFTKMMTVDGEWRKRALELNQQALDLLAKTTHAAEEQAERTARLEQIQSQIVQTLIEDRKEMLELLGRLCGELHDLNSRLTSVEDSSKLKPQ